jgi:NAD(P)-dependent dehydrogenase (short-subunit alcohol dehydrogenase family)
MAGLPFELKGKTVYIAGHRGMVGAALVRRLAAENVDLLTATRGEVDLRDQAGVTNGLQGGREQRPPKSDRILRGKTPKQRMDHGPNGRAHLGMWFSAGCGMSSGCSQQTNVT